MAALFGAFPSPLPGLNRLSCQSPASRPGLISVAPPALRVATVSLNRSRVFTQRKLEKESSRPPPSHPLTISPLQASVTVLPRDRV